MYRRKTFSIVFFCKKTKINRKGKAPVYARITTSGVSTEIYTRCKIEPQHWCQRLERSTLRMAMTACMLTACGIYKPYTRPEMRTDNLYGAEYATADTVSIADIGWRKLLADRKLQRLIDTALVHNTDLQVARLRITEAEATLKAARLAYMPSFNFAPSGGVSSFDGAKAAWTYSVPVTASWEVDIFSCLTNAKQRSRAALLQSEGYRDAVHTQLIADIADYYYRLLSFDAQVVVTKQAV